MLYRRVIPCLLLKNGALVKTIGFRKEKYIGDPINTVRIFNQKEVDELIFLDITATVHNRKPPFDIIQNISQECFMPFSYGGGIRSLDDVKKLFSLGVEKIAINSYAIENHDFITQISNIYGSQSVIISIDVKKDFLGRHGVFSHSGTRKTKYNPEQYAKIAEEYGAGEILLTSMNDDGTMEGYDIDLIKKVTTAVSIPVIACGGAGCVNDLEKAVIQGNASAVAAGSMFVYQGKNRAVLINFPNREELKNVFKG